ncbi:RHS repeat domain-containing protein, partial [Thiohalomonas denitrificans]|uniref:RHS repeat domain-containing protein n=1 Tax=Thiohalomonas denitrificans TaxID=415747 RepID=UPI0026ECB886
RVIKQSRQNLTVYVNQYFSERNGSIGSKHIFVGNTRMLTKVTGGTSFIRSYDGVTDAKTPPGQTKKSDSPEKSNDAQGSANAAGGRTPRAANGKALGKDKNTEKTNNGKALGKDKEKNNNGKSPGKDKNTKAKTKGNFKQGSHPGQGVDNRSDRANEVAMNTCKNKHLIEEHCDEDGNGIPDSQEDGSDGGIEDGTIGDNTDGTEEEIVTLGSNGEQLFYYHPDHLGSTGYVTRENGEVHEHIQYFPFGETWVQQGGNTEKSPYLFTGKELDEETGLYYFGARYYDPRTSVWQSADPILGEYLPDGREPVRLSMPSLENQWRPSYNLRGMGGVFKSNNLALYGYSFSNPVAFMDPDGLSGTLTIHSSGNGGSSMTSGHAWISYTPDPSGGSGTTTTTTYGTWGNNPTEQGNGLFTNLEAGRTGDASRTMHLDDAAETNLMNVISEYQNQGEDAWSLGSPCSGFSRDAWETGTGEDLNANWGPINNPTTLKESIIEANGGANHSTATSPNTASSASSGSIGRSSGSSSLDPLESSLQ